MAEIVESRQVAAGDKELGELLRSRLAQMDQARQDLIDRRRALDAELNRIEEERGHIAALLSLNSSSATPKAVRPDAVSDDPVELVVRLLDEKGPLHYREIERQLRARGWYQAGGADPANTLLAKYFKDSRLYRPRRGVYAIRPADRTVQSVGTRRKGVRRQRRTSPTGA